MEQSYSSFVNMLRVRTQSLAKIGKELWSLETPAIQVDNAGVLG